MRILTYTVAQEDEGRAVRTVVPRRFSLGTHAFRRLKAAGAILVNGEPVHAGRLLHAGELIEVRMSDSADIVSPPSACGEQFSLDAANEKPSFLRYRDDDLLIVSKGAPLPTLPSIHQRTGTLREQVAAMLGQDPRAFDYHPVNRLDKGTSGLLCVALHAHAQRLLTAQLHTNNFVREYLAVTEGLPAKASGVIDAPIARSGEGARRCVREDGQRAVTHYRVERVSNNASNALNASNVSNSSSASNSRALVRLRLETGRTHQIRVHLASIGCPIAGDYLYGIELPELGGRFALHSAYLRLVQPVTGAVIEISEPLPDELSALLDAR